MNNPIEQHIVGILAHELADVSDLRSDDIYIANQNKKITNNEAVYISVGVSSAMPISVSTRYVPDEDGMQEVQESVVREDVQIDMFSASNTPYKLRGRLLMALQSVYAQNVATANSFRIFKIPTNFVNTSGAEGGSNINRYTITVAVHVIYRKTVQLPDGEYGYYDEFSTRVDDEKSIGTDNGIIEFEISEEE